MQYFNTDKLTVGKVEVEQIFEAGSSLGYDIIQVKHGTPAANVTGISGFEIPKTTVNRDGMGTSAKLDLGYFYMYPDAVGNRHGFLLDTEHNRNMLKAFLSKRKIIIIDQKVKEALIAEAEEEGIPVEATAPVKAYQAKSFSTKRAEETLKNKEKRLFEAEKKAEKLAEEAERLKQQLAVAEQRDIARNNTTATETEVNEETGEIETKEVEAKAPVEETKAKSGPKAGRAAKPLAKKTVKK